MVAAQLRKEMHPALAPGYVAVSLRTLSSGDRRLDAEVYLTPGSIARQEIATTFPDAPHLGALARIWQPGRLKGIQVGERNGVPFLAATQVFDIWPSPRKWLAPEWTPDLADRYVQPGSILVTCSGTVGESILAYASHADRVISHDLMRVVPHHAGMTGYLYAYLRTHYGRAMMVSSHYGNVIKHLEVEHLEPLPVPVVVELVEGLGTDIADVFAMRDGAYRLDMEARRRFAEAVGEPAHLDTESGYTVRSASLFSGRRRLDAQAHNPRARAIRGLLDERGLKSEAVETLATTFLPNRFTRTYSEVGEPFWGSEEVFRVNARIDKFLAPRTRIDFDAYRVQKHWLLMARSGQIYGINGTVVLANERHGSGLVSEHIMRIVPKADRIRPGYLQMALGHPDLGTPLILSQAFGTSIPELAPEDIDALPVVRLDQGVEDGIADHVERASELRMKADDKENGAVDRLERELERRIGSPARKTTKMRPDVAETAYRVMLEATGQAPKTPPPHEREATDKNAEAVRRGKKGGRPRRQSGG